MTSLPQPAGRTGQSHIGAGWSPPADRPAVSLAGSADLLGSAVRTGAYQCGEWRRGRRRVPERRPTGIRLRLWQREALAKYETESRKDFLLTATPGAGKTPFALSLAVGLLSRRAIDRVIVVAPTDHLRSQWAQAAERFGIALAPNLGNSVGPVPSALHGYVTPYAQVAGKPTLHAARATTRRSLVILDEIHHAGDGLSW